jgi:hypothetical protein
MWSSTSAKRAEGGASPAFDEPKRHEVGQHPGRLRRTHVGQAGDGPQVELSSRLSQDRENAALDTRDHRFDRSTEVHSVKLPLTTHQ